jgi:hypothetical protein
MEDQQKSEVARLRTQIQAERDAAYAGLYGLSQGSAQHDVISLHMERMGQAYEELKAIDEHAVEFIISTMDGDSHIARAIIEFQNVPSYFERWARAKQSK